MLVFISHVSLQAIFTTKFGFTYCENKGAFKYYISAYGGGSLSQNADTADAFEGDPPMYEKCSHPPVCKKCLSPSPKCGKCLSPLL